MARFTIISQHHYMLVYFKWIKNNREPSWWNNRRYWRIIIPTSLHLSSWGITIHSPRMSSLWLYSLLTFNFQFHTWHEAVEGTYAVGITTQWKCREINQWNPPPLFCLASLLFLMSNCWLYYNWAWANPTWTRSLARRCHLGVTILTP